MIQRRTQFKSITFQGRVPHGDHDGGDDDGSRDARGDARGDGHGGYGGFPYFELFKW